MKKQYIALILAIILGLIFMSGCAHMVPQVLQNSHKMSEEDYQKHLLASQDRYLTERLAATSQFPGMSKQLSPWSITIKQINFRKASTSDTNWMGSFRQYMLGFDVSADVVGHAYVAAAKDRGNSVKKYKADINGRLVAIVSKNIEGYSRDIRHNDWNNALIEFDQNGRTVSALVRQNRTNVESKDASLDFFSFVVFGDGLKSFEQAVSSDELNKSFLQQL